MTIRLSTALANLLATNALCGVYVGGYVSIRTGAQPASPNSVASGTELAFIPMAAWPAAVNGTASLGAAAQELAAASGVAGWARLSDSMGFSIIDGSVGLVASGADFIVNAVAITINQNVTVTSISLAIPRT